MQNAMWVEKDTVSAAERSPEPADQEALVRLSGDAVEALQAIAAQAGLPLLPSLLGCWAILVGRWTMHDDDVSLRVRFSAPHGADRDVEAIALAIGRETLESTLNYRQFAAHLESLLAQAAPALLAEAVGAIVIENDDTAAELSLSLDAQNTLSAAVRRIGGEPGSADRMAQSWQVLLDRIASEPESAVRDLPILTAEERERVLYSFNASTVEFPRNKLMHELFEARVLCNPHSRAVVFNDAEITYDRLNRRANQLARYLVEHGVQPKQIIAVCMDRGIDVVAALLAVLKAGAAYLPLDPGYPEERLAHMLSDACPAALLTDRSTQRRCDHDGIAPGRNIVVEDALQASADYDASNLPRPFQSSTELAYVIYTSGSTGQPKGAMNEHRGMVNRIASQLHVEAMTTGDN
ncbi:MAG: AMP-binding protein, partial [Pseudomonadota bacterium]|nr:AMP-binding protein [Pseudomonadota bacterium]